MSRKIPIHELADILAKNCSISKESAETFIRSFFDLIAESVTAGETVKVKGIGTFAASDNPDNPVDFVPDKSLADTINAPFALFEPEPLSASVSTEMLDEIDQEEEEDMDTKEEIKVNEAIEDIKAKEDIEVREVNEEVAPEPISEPEPEPKPEPEPETEPVVEKSRVTPTPEPVRVSTQTLNPPIFLEEDPEEIVEEEEDRKSGGLGFGWGFVIGLISGLALGACGVYLAINYLFPMPTTIDSEQDAIEAVMEPAPIVVDSVAMAATDTIVTEEKPTAIEEDKEAQQPTPAPEIVKDKIRAGYLIHEMAKKHYGSKAFWVYIYEENKAKIGNPNRLQPGLELVIPAAEKYGIDANSPASIKAANDQAAKILAKYPN